MPGMTAVMGLAALMRHGERYNGAIARDALIGGFRRLNDEGRHHAGDHVIEEMAVKRPGADLPRGQDHGD